MCRRSKFTRELKIELGDSPIPQHQYFAAKDLNFFQCNVDLQKIIIFPFGLFNWGKIVVIIIFFLVSVKFLKGAACRKSFFVVCASVIFWKACVVLTLTATISQQKYLARLDQIAQKCVDKLFWRQNLVTSLEWGTPFFNYCSP